MTIEIPEHVQNSIVHLYLLGHTIKTNAEFHNVRKNDVEVVIDEKWHRRGESVPDEIDGMVGPNKVVNQAKLVAELEKMKMQIGHLEEQLGLVKSRYQETAKFLAAGEALGFFCAEPTEYLEF